MSILIGADIVPTNSNCDFFSNGNLEKLLDEELISKFRSAQYKIFNLEVPLTDAPSPIEKAGPSLVASRSTVEALKKMKIDLLSLANNHIMDQGVDGLKSTMKILDNSNIAYLGVGLNLDAASKPFIFEYSGKRIGVYSCAEHEFSIADEVTPGANPYEPLESFDHVVSLKEKCEYVIVLYHGGKEHYRYPSPMLQKVCRKFVEKGADLVVCQHSHCIGCHESFNGGTIVYGQGNFLFDRKDDEFWSTSLLIEIDSDFNIHYIPLEKKGCSVAVAKENGAQILDDFYTRSDQIKDPHFIISEYVRYAEYVSTDYLLKIGGIKRGFLTKVMDKLTFHKFTKFRLKKRFGKQELLLMKNYFECEAHRELIGQIVSHK